MATPLHVAHVDRSVSWLQPIKHFLDGFNGCDNGSYKSSCSSKSFHEGFGCGEMIYDGLFVWFWFFGFLCCFGDLILDICGFLLPGFLFMTKLHLSDNIAIIIVARRVAVAQLLLLSVQKAGIDKWPLHTSARALPLAERSP